MPFKSKAQRRKFYAMADRGEISRDVVKEWESETKGSLPERLHPKKATMTKTAFWDGFFKKASSPAGDGGKGFWSVGASHQYNPTGQLEYPEREGTEKSHGRAEGEDTRTEKQMRSQERGPVTYNYREVGDVVQNGEVPHILQ